MIVRGITLLEVDEAMGNKNKWLDAGIERMTKKPAYAKANTTILKNALPEKMSAVLLNFAKPLLDEIDINWNKSKTEFHLTVLTSN